MRPQQVLDERNEVLERLEQPVMRDYTKVWIATHFHDSGRLGGKTAREQREMVALHFEALKNTVRVAVPYFVEAEMTRVVHAASAALEDTAHFRLDSLPSPAGFAFFEEPLDVVDSQGKTLLFRAMTWLVLGGLAMVTFFNDIRKPDDITKALLAKHGPNYLDVFGRLQVEHMDFMPDGVRVGPLAFHKHAKTGEPVETTNPMRLVVAFWKMLTQTITVVDDAEVDRHTRKRAIRRSLPHRVSVVKLRRAIYPERRDGESVVDWQHRWDVRGHWRWYRCGPHHPLAEPHPEGGWRAHIWINGYEALAWRIDLPKLPGHETVYNLAR